MTATSPVLAGLCGAAVAAGLWALAAGLYGGRTGDPPARPLTAALGAARDWARRRLHAGGFAGQPRAAGPARTRAAVATAAGMGLWLLSGWPVAGLVAAAAVAGLPALLGASGAASVRIERLEGLEEWTRRLGDVLTVGVGLEQAIAASLRTAPPAIAAEVGALTARLGARWPTEAALRAFADDLHDATGDLVAAALILGSRRRGPGLAAVLDGLAAAVGEEVAMRRKVEADRARPRTTARWVTLITLGVAALAGLNGTYIRPYGTAAGQLVLAGLAAAFAGALLWMRALSRGTPEPRFLPAPAGHAGRPAGTEARDGMDRRDRRHRIDGTAGRAR